MEGSDIKFPFLSRLLKPIITIIRKAAIVFTLTHTLCAFEGLLFLKIYLECSMWINTLKIVKHILVIQTVALFPPSYHVQNRRYTYLLFFHIVCSIEQGGGQGWWCRWCMCYTIISTCLDFYISFELKSLIALELESFGALELQSLRA